MRKVITIIKREYLQLIRSKAFIILTILGPILFASFAVIPAFIMRMKVGEPMRVAIVDQTNHLFDSMRDSILAKNTNYQPTSSPTTNSQIKMVKDSLEPDFMIEPVPIENQSIETIKEELNTRIKKKKLDAYVIIPSDIFERGEAELYSRNVGDFESFSVLKDRLSRPIIEKRMESLNLEYDKIKKLSEKIKLNTIKVGEKGEETSTGAGIVLAYIVSTIIFLAALIYGQVVMGAVIEDKTTRISEVLFSAASAFQIMIGKLIGVMLVALTQYFVWLIAFILLALYSVNALIGSGIDINLSVMNPSLIVYSLIYFILGLFLFTSLYAVVGSVVTTEKEANQMIMPISFILMFGFYFITPVVRNPESSFAFWISLVPFFTPVIMMARIATLTPPLWQILLSMLVMVVSIVLLIWTASRIYRIGMLMYGKKATIPEIIRWVRQT
jgi:ABC-2 type transport system permease protein